jgi:hypothetical protein
MNIPAPKIRALEVGPQNTKLMFSRKISDDFN